MFDPGLSRVVAGLGAWKTPHRIRPRTADSASPLGEGEDRRDLKLIAFRHACLGGDHDRKTPHPRIESGAGSNPLPQERD